MIPEKRTPWYPVIEVDACIGTQDCLKICERNVLQWDAAAGHPVVTALENCEEGCTACMEACPVQAISLPAAPGNALGAVLGWVEVARKGRKETGPWPLSAASLPGSAS